MLETKELVKIYRPKKGVPVTALNKISLKFPEKGMVFLLGKSGSGKSTLLNVLGGLDSYDGGEILIKGVSSKNFRQQHFDSYRNTYVGFIFQEYNVLDEFTVGANIALAIELQNRRASDSEVNDILKEVDLEGYGDRKPNELSGGQKQRVAIARALVKNPEIIMADEPTGALDSNTGRQVLDTLKKLSEKKLVIVVSHDREFAEKYADRIIELSDGVVISDVEADNTPAAESEEKQSLDFHDNVVEVPAGYHITESDREAINAYIEKLNSGSLEITVGKKGSFRKFTKTDISKIKTEDGSGFKLIKSKLPVKNAFKIGSSSLKYKKFRLVMTIFLSCISFGLFGLADTFGAYNHVKTCTNSLIDSGVNYTSMGKAKKTGKGTNAKWREYGYQISEKDISEITENTGVKMHGVFTPYGANLDFEAHINAEKKLTETEYSIYNSAFSGFAEIDADAIKELGFKLLAGELPDGSKNEIAVSEYIFEVFKKAEYFDGKTFKTEKDVQTPVYQKISRVEDLIGKELVMDGTTYKITAVIDTGFDIERYSGLTEKKENQSKAEALLDMVLYDEYAYASGYSYTGVIMVGNGYLNKLIEARPSMSPITEGYFSFYSDNVNVDSSNVASLADAKNEKIIWLNGAKTELGEKEIIVTSDALTFFNDDGSSQSEDNPDYAALLKNKDFTMWSVEFSEGEHEYKDTEGYKIVGVIETGENTKFASTVIGSDSLYKKFAEGRDNIYSFAVGAMPSDREGVKNMVAYCYREDSNVRYPVQNSVTYELDSLNDVLKVLSKYFLYIGIGFALFAALMLANFIGTSISYKKQEIGILRAIGSRSNDVFRIFFAESFIIAAINFVLSCTGVFVVTAIINYLLRTHTGILITVLSFGPRQILLLMAVSILVAFVASFFPVKRIASKRPIDAIRNR